MSTEAVCTTYLCFVCLPFFYHGGGVCVWQHSCGSYGNSQRMTLITRNGSCCRWGKPERLHKMLLSRIRVTTSYSLFFAPSPVLPITVTLHHVPPDHEQSYWSISPLGSFSPKVLCAFENTQEFPKFADSFFLHGGYISNSTQSLKTGNGQKDDVYILANVS